MKLLVDGALSIDQVSLHNNHHSVQYKEYKLGLGNPNFANFCCDIVKQSYEHQN